MPDLSAFAGDWTLERWIDDRTSGATGRLVGRGRFGWRGGVLVYEEHGRLRMDGAAALQASQCHLWDEADGRIRVRFRDGRPFHSFDATATYAKGRHLCGADLYEVLYDFSSWPVWTATWTVSGPRKSYTTCSAYVGR